MERFEDWFAVEYPKVTAALTIALHDRALAEEAAQEAFARAWRRWRSVAGADRPAAWVYVVAVRVAHRHRRRERDRPAPVPGRGTDDMGGVVDAVWVRDALRRLPARQREAIVLRYLADLPVRDVARAMRCREGTVKSTLHAALAAMKIDVADRDGGGW